MNEFNESLSSITSAISFNLLTTLVLAVGLSTDEATVFAASIMSAYSYFDNKEGLDVSGNF